MIHSNAIKKGVIPSHPELPNTKTRNKIGNMTSKISKTHMKVILDRNIPLTIIKFKNVLKMNPNFGSDRTKNKDTMYILNMLVTLTFGGNY